MAGEIKGVTAGLLPVLIVGTIVIVAIFLPIRLFIIDREAPPTEEVE